MAEPEEDARGFEQCATAVLRELWSELEAVPLSELPVGDISALAFEVFQYREIGWKYSILIQAAGKAADCRLDALCLQKGTGRLGQWEPREFAKRVVVPWNKSIGAPLGTSGDPYVNNIFRRPRFDDPMREGRRSKAMFDTVRRILDTVQTARSPNDARAFLRLILAQLRKYLSGRSFDYPVPQRASLHHVLDCIGDYVNIPSGGMRLQAVAHGLILALRAKGIAYDRIQSRHVNAADAATRSAGDVECFTGEINVLTIEVKDRELTALEVDGAIAKARLANVRELLFFVHRRNGRIMAEADADEIDRMVRQQFALGLNIYIERASDILRLGCTLLGEDGRKRFLEFVGSALEEQGADAKHRWAWSQAVREIGTQAGQTVTP